MLDVSGAPALTTIAKGETDNPGDPVTDILGSMLSDVDTGDPIGLAVIDLDPGNGTWQFSLDDGLSWSDVGAVSQSAALLLEDDDRVRFVPDGQAADSAWLGYRGWDRSGTTATGAGTKVPIDATGGTTPFSNQSDTASVTVTDVRFPDDPRFNDQWNLHNTGQGDGTDDADTDMPEAWGLITGSREIVVGVIDSGIDPTHVDLYRNIWINPGEIPETLGTSITDTDSDGLISFEDLNDPTNASHITDHNDNGYMDARDLLLDSGWANGIDEDGNGYVDDLYGWDFVNQDNDPFDDGGHGTHVAGTIGASGDNATGATGINWVSSLIALKTLDGSTPPQGEMADAIEAIEYATNLRTRETSQVNLRVLNHSYGFGGVAGESGRQALAAALAKKFDSRGRVKSSGCGCRKRQCTRQ